MFRLGKGGLAGWRALCGCNCGLSCSTLTVHAILGSCRRTPSPDPLRRNSAAARSVISVSNLATNTVTIRAYTTEYFSRGDIMPRRTSVVGLTVEPSSKPLMRPINWFSRKLFPAMTMAANQSREGSCTGKGTATGRQKDRRQRDGEGAIPRDKREPQCF